MNVAFEPSCVLDSGLPAYALWVIWECSIKFLPPAMTWGKFCNPTAWSYPLTSLAGYGENSFSRQDETSPEVNPVSSSF